MPAMVSQSQENEWEHSPSRAGSMLSLDGRQRPMPAKTPPSYYDAVRSRHSLSQPVNKSPESLKQEKIQQVKYNSLPRPLPQRYPQANGHPVRNTWSEDYYDPSRTNGNVPRGGEHMRQQYDSPPKPANRVPLQLQVHQEKCPPKRSYDLPESYTPGSRGVNSIPRQSTTEKLTVDCNRGNGMVPNRKEGLQSLTLRPDSRPPPPLHRMPQQRGPPMPNGMENANSLTRRDSNPNSGLLRRCYPILPNGATPSPCGYPAPPRTPIDNSSPYEPRYSKSGKLCPRPVTQDPRPMPPPVVMLRTGPLGTYPDAETLKRREMSMYNQPQQDRSMPNAVDYERQHHRTPSHGDVSQQIFVDTNSYSNGQPMVADHLAIPYRIPQVSPKNSHVMYDGNQNGTVKKEQCPRSQPSPSHLQNVSGELKSRTLPTMSRLDSRNRTPHDRGGFFEPRTAPSRRPAMSTSSLPSDKAENDAIYANQFYPTPNGSKDYDQQRPPQMSGPLYENSHPSMRNGMRSLSETNDSENVYANHHIASTHYNTNQQMYDNKHVKTLRSDRRNTHPPPPVAQKPSHSLPQPSEMMMVTETRGWNGQASSTYAKDVVKPTPRMPRLPNGILASGGQLAATVPAYQCVINELSSHPLHHISPPTTNSSTLSLRSGYDSSSSSSREFGRRPTKSDSSAELGRASENSLKSNGGHQQIDKSLLSVSMTSLCSDASSSISLRPRQHHEDGSWERMNEETQKRKDTNSVFSASPWEREEKEKLHQEQVLDARRARDQEIAYLESVGEKSEKQAEWLRILRLEREFQRRAELEPDDEEGSVCSDSSDTDSNKVETFHRDKLTVIPNERMGLKLLDELLENSPKSSSPPDKCTSERDQSLRNTPEKHFIPLDVTIPENELQPPSLPLTNNILKISSEHPEQQQANSNNRLSKPPVPAPRPSKAVASALLEAQRLMSADCEPVEKADMDRNVSSLTKLDISDPCAYFCSTESLEHPPRDISQDNWLIEVPSNFQEVASPDQQISTSTAEESRIYENIKPADYHYLRTNSASGYSSHTLPKTTVAGTGAVAPTRNGTRHHFEKKFPIMGVSSTLTKKSNGFVPSDADILPSLYASCKVQNGYVKEMPSDLVDKSPEFKKMWIQRPEKLTFQDKIRKFSLQAGEDDLPRDRVKNSRAQREIEIKFNESQKRAAGLKASEA